MAKSKKRATHIFYPYPNIMVVERYYEFVDGHDEHRQNDKPLEEKDGWTGYFTTWEKVKTDSGKFEICREVYAKKAKLFSELATGKKTKGKPKRHFVKKTI